MQTIRNQPSEPTTPRPSQFIDPVSRLSFYGGISRMDDDAGVIECPPSPKTTERSNRRAAAYAKFQSDAAAAAKFLGQRCKYSTNVVYLPATNPSFPEYVRERIRATAELTSAAAASPYDDVTLEQVPILVEALQSLRIRLNIDPVTMTIDELRALCAETSRAEAVAYADMSSSASMDPHPETDPLLISYSYAFVKRTRLDLEAEIQRCQKRSFNLAAAAPTPTPHARIGCSVHHRFPWFSNIVSSDTLNRKFISVNALILAVSADIQKFLTCPRRGPDRVAVTAVSQAALQPDRV